MYKNSSLVLVISVFYVVLCSPYIHAYSILGSVVNPDGELCAECEVWLVHALEGVSRCTTNSEGRFKFDGLPFGEISLIVRCKGYAVDGVSFLLTKDDFISFTLKKNIVQIVKVYDPNLSKLAGAEVRRIWVNNKFCIPLDEIGKNGYGTLRSSDNGEITIPDFPPEGFFRILVSHIDYADTYLPYLPISESKPASVIMSKGVILRGKVTKDRTPIEGASIIVLQKGTGYQPYTVPIKTNSDGLYRLRLPKGEYKIFANHQKFPNTEPKDLSISDSEEELLMNFEFRDPLLIEGRVVFPDGSPCRFAKVILKEPSGMEDFTFTGEDGSYLLKANENKVLIKIMPPPGFMTDTLPEINVDFKDLTKVTAPLIKLKELPIVNGEVKYSSGEVADRVLIRSKNLEFPIFTLTDSSGKFKIFFEIFPDVDRVDFVAEHALRFLKSEFSVNLFNINHSNYNKIVLHPFEPVQDKFVNPPGLNQLAHLIDKSVPKINCRNWFNYTPQGDIMNALKGKVVLLLFWGGFDITPLGVMHVEEMRVLNDLYRGISDVQMLSIHDGTSEDEDVEEFIKNYRIEFPVGIDTESADTFNSFSIKFIPQFILIDKSGILRYTDVIGRSIELIKVLRRAG
ncbi:MAG: carboxypeptidase regulatory-like domain-containing protein [Candidatus Hydrogenedentes bacterium]|nr:carboxypeptidase regulatory-like domain-containing protein [Candidatus Hydrogenedentota bacterium]